MKDPEIARVRALFRKYGIELSDDQAHAHVLARHSGCHICGQADYDRVLALDHNHETGQPRGWLCSKCNRAIGCFRDDPAILRRAADYLDQHAAPVEA